MSSQLSRAEAWDLLTEWVESPSLRRHCLAVEAAMVGYARKNGEDEERWAVAGLLHDADYERFSDMDDDSVYWAFVVLTWLPIYLLVYWAPRWAP